MTPNAINTAGGTNDTSADELRRFLGLLIRLFMELGVSYPLFQTLTHEVREALAHSDTASDNPSSESQSNLPSPERRSVTPELQMIAIASLLWS